MSEPQLEPGESAEVVAGLAHRRGLVWVLRQEGSYVHTVVHHSRLRQVFPRRYLRRTRPPCRRCKGSAESHVEAQCLFQSTQYVPENPPSMYWDRTWEIWEPTGLG